MRASESLALELYTRLLSLHKGASIMAIMLRIPSFALKVSQTLNRKETAFLFLPITKRLSVYTGLRKQPKFEYTLDTKLPFLTTTLSSHIKN